MIPYDAPSIGETLGGPGMIVVGVIVVLVVIVLIILVRLGKGADRR
jgi:hypothetical protein